MNEDQSLNNRVYCRCRIDGKPGAKLVNASHNPAYCGNCKKQIEPGERPQLDKLMSIEECERVIANHNSGIQFTQVSLYQQLADTMRELKTTQELNDSMQQTNKAMANKLLGVVRENERLREALESIRTSKHPMAIEIEHMCEDALGLKGEEFDKALVMLQSKGEKE